MAKQRTEAAQASIDARAKNSNLDISTLTEAQKAALARARVSRDGDLWVGEREGDAVTGVVQSVGSLKTKYGAYTVLRLTTSPDGGTLAVGCNVALKNALIEEGVLDASLQLLRRGAPIVIAYHGMRPTKNGENEVRVYGVAVVS